MGITTLGGKDDGTATPDPAPRRDWKAEGIALLTATEARDVFIPELFEMISAFSQAGDFDSARKLSEMVVAHPHATPVDRYRTMNCQSDILRREGRPQEALDELNSLRAVFKIADPVAHAEWLQARSECYKALGDLANAEGDKRAVTEVCASTDSIPADKKFFYESSRIDVQLIRGTVDGATLTSYIEAYEKARETFPEDKRTYAAHDFHAIAGQAFLALGQLEKALEHFKLQQSVDHAEMFRVVGALRYLAARWGADREDRSPETMEMVSFYRAHHGKMKQGWLTVLGEKYDLVNSVIAEIDSAASAS